MNEENNPDEHTNDRLPKGRSRIDNRPVVTATDTNSDTPKDDTERRKQKVLQPLPGGNKAREEMLDSAEISDQAPSTPVNTTTIPGAVSTDSTNKFQPSGAPANRSQVLPGETTGQSSYLPPQEHLDSLQNPDLAAMGQDKKSNKTMVVVLSVFLLIAILTGAGWLLLSA